MKREKASSPSGQPNFEQDLEKLEAVVAALEEGGLPLDAALKHFEDGIRLAQRCEKALTEAEKRIEVLTRNAEGDLEAKPFGREDEGPAPPARPAVPATEAPIDQDTEEEDEELLF